MGWEVQFTSIDWAQLRTGKLIFVLYVPGGGHGGTGNPGGNMDIHLAVENLEGLEAQLQAYDANLEIGVFTNYEGIKYIRVKDPDNNTWIISKI